MFRDPTPRGHSMYNFFVGRQRWINERDYARRVAGSAVMMLDADGNLPKVALTAPWLSYLNYTLCGVEPFSETRHACVCTPYIFNKYKGIFGLTGSVGGKAELKYLGLVKRA